MAKKGRRRQNGFAIVSEADRQAAIAAREESQRGFVTQFDALYERKMSGAEAVSLCHQAIEAQVFNGFGEITSAVKQQFGGNLALLSQRLQNPLTADGEKLMAVLQARVDSLREQMPAQSARPANGRKSSGSHSKLG